ncbi:8761_t:CDS:1, partial [Gigaspora margarita]
MNLIEDTSIEYGDEANMNPISSKNEILEITEATFTKVEITSTEITS